MEKKQYIVLGEAPESDSEEEVDVSMIKRGVRLANSTTPHGLIVAGEAPESDEEDKVSVSSISSAASISSIASFTAAKKTSNEKPKKVEAVNYNSLLHRKLRERNMSLHRNVVEFVHHTTGSAARDIHAANLQLMKSQMQLQDVVLALQALNMNLGQLQTKMVAATSSKFLSHINMHHR